MFYDLTASILLLAREENFLGIEFRFREKKKNESFFKSLFNDIVLNLIASKLSDTIINSSIVAIRRKVVAIKKKKKCEIIRIRVGRALNKFVLRCATRKIFKPQL